MNILVVSQYFWPETFIINQLVQCLVNDGHKVEIITGKPNYPEGVIFNGYIASGCSSELYLNNIPVHRAPIVPRGQGAKRLVINYLSYIFSGLFYFPRFVKSKKFDVIFVFAPSPITSAIPAIYLKWRYRTHLAVWVQDLWPESLKATGFIKSSFLLRLIGPIVKGIYAFSDTLLAQSQAFIPYMKKYVSEDKIIYYPNSFLESELNDVDSLPESLLMELEQNCCFVFAGNLGKAQALETIVQAAEMIAHLPNCKILLIGSGSMGKVIHELVEEKKIKNILLPGRFESSVMQAIFSRAAGLLVSLKKEEIFSYTVPSKIQSYLAAGRPILAALDGEGSRIIAEAGAGLISPAEDARTLAKNMEQLYYMPASQREQIGKAGRKYFLEHFEMAKQSKRLIEIFKTRIQKKRISK